MERGRELTENNFSFQRPFQAKFNQTNNGEQARSVTWKPLRELSNWYLTPYHALVTSSGSIRSCDIRPWDLQKLRVKDVAQVFGKRDSSFSVEPEARSRRCGITERDNDYHYNKALIDPLVHSVALTLMPQSPRTSPLVDRKLT